MTLLERVTDVLDRSGIAYALIGAGALAVHAIGRSTFDVDLLAVDGRALAPGTWSDLAGTGVSVDIRRGDPDDPLEGVVRIELRGERPVDIVVGRSSWQARCVERASRTTLGSSIIPVVAVADLVLLKLYAGGVQDLWDVQQLLGLDPAAHWIPQVDHEVGDLGPDAAAAWSRLRLGRT